MSKSPLDQAIHIYQDRMWDYYKSEAGLDGVGYPMSWDDELRQAFLRWVETAIIGEDEQELTYPTWNYAEVGAMNHLRAQQRAKLKKAGLTAPDRHCPE